MRITPGSRVCLGKWAWPLSRGAVVWCPNISWGGWGPTAGPSPWLALQMFNTEPICHKVIPKSGRMHQEWPEFGGLYRALLWQATGYICVNSQEIKKQFLPGTLVIRQLNRPPVWGHVIIIPRLLIPCWMQVKAWTWAGTMGQLDLSLFLCRLLIAFVAENWTVDSLGAVLSHWCCLNILIQESKAWRHALCSFTFGRLTWKALQWLRSEILLHPPVQAVTFLIRYLWT